MTNKEREALPIGSEGWRYKRGTWIPKGQWIEELAVPEHPRPGSTVTKIRWGSNGVGVPSMTLIGSVKGAIPQDRSDDPPPIPHRNMDWSYAHKDYDGAPSGDLRDSRDTRYGYCGS